MIERNERPLFSYQEQAVDRLLDWYRGSHRTGVLVLPTGAGKTRVAAELVARTIYQTRGGASCLWLAHRSELVDQAVAALASLAHRASFEFDIGRYQGGAVKVDIPVKVVVASIPSLVWRTRDNTERLDTLWRRQGGFDLVIVDEAHHAAARTWSRLIRRIKQMPRPPHVLGLTATPTRHKANQRGALFELLEGVLFEAQPIPLIRSGHLARPSINLVATGRTFELTQQEAEEANTFGELPEGVVRRIATDEARNELAVRTFLEGRERWGRTLFFGGRVEQSRYLVERLRAAGVRAAAVDADTPVAERREILASFRSGKLEALCNVMVFTEGTDAPGTQSVFLVRPTRSPILFQQMVGRAMRGPEVGGVERCNVVAFVDHLQGLAERQVAHNYTWEWEQWANLGFAEEFPPDWLGNPPIPGAAPSTDSKRSKTHAPSLTSEVDDVREEVRDRLTRDSIDLATLRSTLSGWWQIREPQEAGPPRAWPLPFFDGDAALRPWIAALIARTKVRAPTTSRANVAIEFLAENPVPPRIPTLSAVTAAAFASRTLSSAIPRTIEWIDITRASDADIATFAHGMREWSGDAVYQELLKDRIWRQVPRLGRRWAEAKQKRCVDEPLLKQLTIVERDAVRAFGEEGSRSLQAQLYVAALGAPHRTLQERLRQFRRQHRAGATGVTESKLYTDYLDALLAPEQAPEVPAGDVGSLGRRQAVPLSTAPDGVVTGRVLRLRVVEGLPGLEMAVGAVDGTHAVAMQALSPLADEVCVGHFIVAPAELRGVEGRQISGAARGHLTFSATRRRGDEAGYGKCPRCARQWLYVADDHSTSVCSRCGRHE